MERADGMKRPNTLLSIKRLLRSRKIRFYSHNGEDCLLWDFFGGIRTGFFVDIGAFDGIHLSNTFCFERQGWKGICVEAHPDYYSLLQKNRPASQCLHYACIGDRNRREAVFHVEKMGLLSSTLGSPEYMEDVKARYRRRGLIFEGFDSVKVPAASLDMILENYHHSGSPIDLISLDVEGTELEVLMGFDCRRYSPRIIVVESNNEKTTQNLVTFLAEEEAYLFAGRLNENLFFVRNLYDLRKIRDIQIHCRIQKQVHPLGREYTLKECLADKIVDDTKPNRLVWKDLE